jgi:hypothetical protein
MEVTFLKHLGRDKEIKISATELVHFKTIVFVYIDLLTVM